MYTNARTLRVKNISIHENVTRRLYSGENSSRARLKPYVKMYTRRRTTLFFLDTVVFPSDNAEVIDFRGASVKK